MPLVHKNLAQIARTWIGGQILTAIFDEAAITSSLTPCRQQFKNHMEAASSPADLIQWSSNEHLTRGSTIQNSGFEKHTFLVPTQHPLWQQHSTVPSTNSSSALNPLAPIFLPQRSKRHPKPMEKVPTTTVNISQRYKAVTNKSEVVSSRKNGPSKCTSFLLPGQSLLTKYISPKHPPPPVSQQSLSMPSQDGGNNSKCEDLSPTPTTEPVAWRYGFKRTHSACK